MTNKPVKQKKKKKLNLNRDGVPSCGRAAYYNSPEQMQVKIDEYFEQAKTPITREIITKRGETKTITQMQPLSMAALSLFLGFSSAKELWDYEHHNEGYAQVIARARTRIEVDALNGGLTGQYEPKISGLHLIKHGYHAKGDQSKDNNDKYKTLSDQQLMDRVERLLRNPENRALAAPEPGPVIDIKVDE